MKSYVNQIRDEDGNIRYLHVAYNGVFVSINPRNVPCAASAITTAGAPNALKVRKLSAGNRIGESCKTVYLYDNALTNLNKH